jgi:hypothetical protein
MICNKCKKDVMATIHDLCIECHDDIPRDPIVEAIIRKFMDRSIEGIKKYGVTMDRKDLSVEEWIDNAIEESMDFILYLYKLKKEIQNGSKTS